MHVNVIMAVIGSLLLSTGSNIVIPSATQSTSAQFFTISIYSVMLILSAVPARILGGYCLTSLSFVFLESSLRVTFCSVSGMWLKHVSNSKCPGGAWDHPRPSTDNFQLILANMHNQIYPEKCLYESLYDSCRSRWDTYRSY